MTCARSPPHSDDEQAHARVVLGVLHPRTCAACILDGDDPLEEPGPNLDLAPAGPFFDALAQAYRLADARDRAALKYAFPTLSALVAWRGR